MNNPTETQTPKPRAEDVESPDAIIQAMYGTISGPAGSRNWSRFRSLYLPGARLIPAGKRIHRDDEDFKALTVDEWIEDVREYLQENDFWEQEIMRHTDRFGPLIQAFSTYEARNDPEAEPIARGINAIQLVLNEKRWWIASMVWNNESRNEPIPGEFLPYLW